MKKLTLVATVGLTLFTSAQAQQVYRCETPDGMVFSQTPCAPTAEQHRVLGAGEPDPITRLNAEQRLQRIRDEQRQRELEEQQAAKEREEAQLRHIRRMQLIAHNKVAIGMSKDDVLKSWGEPDRINRTLRSSSTSEQWVYRSGREKAQYVYIRDGVVSSIQD